MRGNRKEEKSKRGGDADWVRAGGRCAINLHRQSKERQEARPALQCCALRLKESTSPHTQLLSNCGCGCGLYRARSKRACHTFVTFSGYLLCHRHSSRRLNTSHTHSTLILISSPPFAHTSLLLPTPISSLHPY